MAGQGLRVAACDSHAENVKILHQESSGIPIRIAADVAELVGILREPRNVAVTSSETGSDLFNELQAQLEAGDLLIDVGDCHFKECLHRARYLTERNLRYLEISFIDREENSSGPILIVGGRVETWHRASPLLDPITSNEIGESSVTHLGPAGAGHFVKMIYEGVEYSLTHLVLESFEVLKRALNLDDKGVQDATSGWFIGPLNRFRRDDAVRWTSQAAGELSVPSPTLDAVVGMRALSETDRQNNFATTPFRHPIGHFGDDAESILTELHGALYTATLITHAQGMAVLAAGSEHYGFEIDPVDIIRLWRICCGHRAALLDEIASALRDTLALPNLLDDDNLSEKVMEQQECLRHAVWRATSQGISVPGLMASLDYLDSYRGAWLPINLIQPPPLAGLVRR
jgi:6-phosphogluconate dehydrogenase